MMSRPVVKPAPVRTWAKAQNTARKATAASARAGPSMNGDYLYTAGIRDASNRITEYRTDSDQCPICKTDRQFRKDLRLLVSPCYHKACMECIERLFAAGPEPCPHPGCGKILRKVNFQHQTFEDLKVEKEIAVRRRVAEQYNKRREDFTSDREYDDFLEEAEDITFNLLNGVDIDETERRLSEFEKKNAALLAANKRKAEKEQNAMNRKDEAEKQAKEDRRRLIAEYDDMEEKEAIRVKAEVVQALANGQKDRARALQRSAINDKAKRAIELEQSLGLNTPLDPQDIPQNTTIHLPTSPSYAGPFVPYAVSDPDEAAWKGWYDFKKGKYADARASVREVMSDREGKFRAGAYDLDEFWEMEIRAAVQSLGIEPLE